MTITRSDECRFVSPSGLPSLICRVHDPDLNRLDRQGEADLCHHAAAALQARVRELERDYGLLRELASEQEHRADRAVATVARLVDWDRKWYPALAGRAMGLQQSDETIAAERWSELCQELRAALAPDGEAHGPQ